NPNYAKEPSRLIGPRSHELDIQKNFKRFEGKIVVQAFADAELLDEMIVITKPGRARLVTASRPTEAGREVPDGMVRIPAGIFSFKTTHGDDFIPYPEQVIMEYTVNSFLMDRHQVTNIQFKAFLDATKYTPSDAANFLKHWKNGSIAKGEEQHPVVFVSYEDAAAYANW